MAEKEKIETNDVAEDKVVKKTTKGATASKVKVDKETVQEVEQDEVDYKKENEELRKKLEGFEDKFELMFKMIANNSAPQVAPVPQPQATKYKIVNLTSDSNVTYLKVGNDKYRLQGYGDFRYFNEDQFREIIRTYRNLFNIGRLTTDGNGLEILEDMGIKAVSRFLSDNELEKVGNLNAEELGNLCSDLHLTQQEKLVEAFLEGIAQDKEGYKDYQKLVSLSKNYQGFTYNKQRIKNAILKISE